jgi:hypothetical protein
LQNKTILLLLAGGNKSGQGKGQNKDIDLAIKIRDFLKEKGEI